MPRLPSRLLKKPPRERFYASNRPEIQGLIVGPALPIGYLFDAEPIA